MSEVVAENVKVREPFVCDTDMKAEWCLSKIRKIRAEQARETEELERQMQFYVAEQSRVKAEADADVAFFEGILRAYFENRVDAGFVKETKSQVTYKLPSGTLMMKHREPEYKKDDATFVQWLKDNGLQGFVKTKETPNWDGLKKTLKKDDKKNPVRIETENGVRYVTEDGLVIDCVEVIDREDVFSVEVN